jgi:signal transduction histidine kinase
MNEGAERGQTNEGLEMHLQERIAELAKSNEALRTEVLACRRTEQVARGQIEALAKTLKLLAAQPERDKSIGQVLKAITEQLRAHSGGFWFYDNASATTCLHLDYYQGQVLPAARTPQLAMAGMGSYQPGEALSGGEKQPSHRLLTLHDDIANDPRLDYCRDYLLVRGIHTVLLIPLFFENEFIGSFSIHSVRPCVYAPDEIELAQALAQQAVLAVQLARLAEQSRQAAVLEERNRIAREIHDTLAQAFTGMLIQLGVAQRIAGQQPEEAWSLIGHVSELARQGLAEVRRSVWALQPEALQYSDLASVLPRTIAQMTAATPIQAQVHIHGSPRSLAADVGMNLLRIGQEAVNNTLRHADARNIFIELTFDVEQVRLCIQDDGQGFELQHQEDGGGFGLIGMRQRAERIGGQLTIASQSGQGTEVAVVAPTATAQRHEGET